jgi:beta-glucosidase
MVTIKAMKTNFRVWLVIGLLAITGPSAFAQKKLAKEEQQMMQFITALLKKMTLEEKIGQLNLVSSSMDVTGPFVKSNYKEDLLKGKVGGIFNAYTPSFVRQIQEIALKQTRLGIPLIIGYDVIHGHKTIFPIPLGLSCSWDMNLIRKMARISAEEASADGINWVFSPMVDISRDPRWGRVAEGAGEDAWYGSQVAAAMVKGYQGNDLGKDDAVMACVKHFALYGASLAGRDYNSVNMGQREMLENYLPPYLAAVKAGAGSVMSSFNDIDGIPATMNKWLLTDLLRKQWGFNGFVTTDYTAVKELLAHNVAQTELDASVLALKAGVDMDMVDESFINTLAAAVKNGQVSLAQVDMACGRVLAAKYRLGLFKNPYRNIGEERALRTIMSQENRAAAREIARKSIVLLKNDSLAGYGALLPLKKDKTIALIGPLANSKPDVLGNWAGAGDARQAVSVLEGLKSAGVEMTFAKGANITDDEFLLSRLPAKSKKKTEGMVEEKSPAQLLTEALETAAKADVIVAVLGESKAMSGEAASRADIGLPESQKILLKALLKTGKPLVLLLMNGRPLTLAWENEHVPAILETWFLGTEAGNAIADVLFGDYNPAGKLTMTFPYSVGQIPLSYNHKHTGRPEDEKQKYTSKYLDVPNQPLYPFGYGLSYTRFAYTDLSLDKKSYSEKEMIRVAVKVANVGNYDGEEVVQLYLSDLVASVSRPVRELKAFRKIFLKKGESKTVQLELFPEDLKFYDLNMKWTTEPGTFKIAVGTNSNAHLETTFNLKMNPNE